MKQADLNTLQYTMFILKCKDYIEITLVGMELNV